MSTEITAQPITRKEMVAAFDGLAPERVMDNAIVVNRALFLACLYLSGNDQEKAISLGDKLIVMAATELSEMGVIAEDL